MSRPARIALKLALAALVGVTASGLHNGCGFGFAAWQWWAVMLPLCAAVGWLARFAR